MVLAAAVETARLETRLRSAFGLKSIPFAKDLEPDQSTLLRVFLAGLPRAGYAVCYLAHSNCATVDLFRDIARASNSSHAGAGSEVLHDIQERLLKLSRTQKIRPLLFIDDAHLLPGSALDEIRLLTTPAATG